jgi:hypothetical protein
VPSSDQERGRGGDEGPASPRIPSFESLRAPRRRNAVDVLTPGLGPVAEVPVAEVPVAEVPVAEVPVADVRPPAARPATGPRPATYADLLPFGLRLASAVLTGPARCLRRLLGEQRSPRSDVRR